MLNTSPKEINIPQKALVVVSAGTSDLSAAENIKSILPFFEENTAADDTFCAFTSASAVKTLIEEHGVYIEYLPDLMEKLYMLGYKEITVLSLHLNEDTEYTKMLNMTTPYARLFKELQITKPLLSDSGTAKELIKILSEKYKKNDTELVLEISENLTVDSLEQSEFDVEIFKKGLCSDSDVLKLFLKML